MTKEAHGAAILSPTELIVPKSDSDPNFLSLIS